MNSSILVLKIDIPNTLGHQYLFGWSNIPCVCKVAGGVFQMSFVDPLPSMEGVVEGWSRAELELRAPPYVGGKVSFHFYATVSLDRVGAGEFSISQLSAFIPTFPGWFPLMKAGHGVIPSLGILLRS